MVLTSTFNNISNNIYVNIFRLKWNKIVFLFVQFCKLKCGFTK